MLKQFVKLQSLGNDFILFDWYKRPCNDIQNVLQGKDWPEFVVKICKRHFGVGADSVLILKENHDFGLPEMLIFNSDGSQAEACFNGIRCCAQFLYQQYSFGESFKIVLSKRIIECVVCKDGCSSVGCKKENTFITNNVGQARFLGEQTVNTTNEGVYQGFCVDVGNPHFVTFNKTTSQWLVNNGSQIESNAVFPKRTNVEFVWKDDTPFEGLESFKMLVYERGCGVTLACSTGAAAVIATLFKQGMIQKNKKIVLDMQGGKVIAWLDADENIFLQASAHLVFNGTF